MVRVEVWLVRGGVDSYRLEHQTYGGAIDMISDGVANGGVLRVQGTIYPAASVLKVVVSEG